MAKPSTPPATPPPSPVQLRKKAEKKARIVIPIEDQLLIKDATMKQIDDSLTEVIKREKGVVSVVELSSFCKELKEKIYPIYRENTNPKAKTICRILDTNDGSPFMSEKDVKNQKEALLVELESKKIKELEAKLRVAESRESRVLDDQVRNLTEQNRARFEEVARYRKVSLKL